MYCIDAPTAEGNNFTVENIVPSFLLLTRKKFKYAGKVLTLIVDYFVLCS